MLVPFESKVSTVKSEAKDKPKTKVDFKNRPREAYAIGHYPIEEDCLESIESIFIIYFFYQIVLVCNFEA